MGRRAVLLCLAILLSAGLTACGSGGYAFNTSSGSTQVDNITLTNGSGQSNVFIVAPPLPLGGGQPPSNYVFVDRNNNVTTAVPVIQVNATGTIGSAHTVVPGAVFTWTAKLTTNDTSTYSSGQNGVQKQCFPATSATGGTVLPDVSPYSPTPVIWVQQSGFYRPLRPQELQSTVYVSPAPVNLVVYEIGEINYCITLTAVGNGAQAQTQVAVTSTP